MSRANRVLMVLGLLGAIMVASGPAIAQEKPADNMAIVLEKIRADKKFLVAENMQLTEAEAKGFWPVYSRYQDEPFLLRGRTAKLITDYAAAYDQMNNDTAKKLLDESLTIEALGLKLRRAYLPKFRAVLPEVKVVRYYQIENKIHAVLVYEIASKIPLVRAAGLARGQRPAGRRRRGLLLAEGTTGTTAGGGGHPASGPGASPPAG